MLSKTVLSWVGRLVGIAAVITSPLVARAAEATDPPTSTKQMHRAPASHGHAKKKAAKRGTRHESAPIGIEKSSSEKSDDKVAIAKGEPRASHKALKSVKPEIVKGDDSDVTNTDVTEEVIAERASTKAPPKPSKTPLPTIAAAATVPRMEVIATCAAPVQKEEKPVQKDERAHAERSHSSKAHAEKARADRGHATEPRATPFVRATLRTSDEPVTHKSKHAKSVCLHAPVEVTRGSEDESFPLTKCDGSLAPLAVEEMSILSRPGSAAKPSEPIAELAAKADKKDSDELAPGIKRIDGRLVERLQLMLDHFAKPSKTPQMFVVSGYRPTSKGSFHATGRAIDFRIEGVENTDLVAFCKTLDDTGCGFYPNSSFIHMDVRDAKTGHVAWIDASSPGEKPEYVASWPPPPKQDEEDPVKILARLDELQVLPMEDAKDTESAKTSEDSKDDDADSEPGVLLKPIIDEKRRASTDE
jgi:hypothetical protein